MASALVEALQAASDGSAVWTKRASALDLVERQITALKVENKVDLSTIFTNINLRHTIGVLLDEPRSTVLRRSHQLLTTILRFCVSLPGKPAAMEKIWMLSINQLLRNSASAIAVVAATASETLHALSELLCTARFQLAMIQQINNGSATRRLRVVECLFISLQGSICSAGLLFWRGHLVTSSIKPISDRKPLDADDPQKGISLVEDIRVFPQDSGKCDRELLFSDRPDNCEMLLRHILNPDPEEELKNHDKCILHQPLGNLAAIEESGNLTVIFGDYTARQRIQTSAWRKATFFMRACQSRVRKAGFSYRRTVSARGITVTEIQEIEKAIGKLMIDPSPVVRLLARRVLRVWDLFLVLVCRTVPGSIRLRSHFDTCNWEMILDCDTSGETEDALLILPVAFINSVTLPFFCYLFDIYQQTWGLSGEEPA